MKNIKGDQNLFRRQNGGALIYLLFIITFVSIVLPVMLLTVTQGQRHLLQYEQQQMQDYLSEGALEVVINRMENFQDEQDESKRGIYYYLVHEVMENSHGVQTIPVLIDGHTLEVTVELDSTNTSPFKAYVYDSDNPSIKKVLTVQAPSDNGGNEGLPRFDDGRPSISFPDGGHAYEELADGEYRLTCVSQPDGSDVITCSDLIRQTGGLESEGCLVIFGNIHLGYVQNYDSIRFTGKEGVFIAADLSTSSYQKIEIYSEQGDIYIGDGATIDSSNELHIEAPRGHVVIENGALSSQSYNNIELHAGKYISLVDVTLHSTRNVHLEANNLYGHGSQLVSTNNGTVELTGQHSVWLEMMELKSTNLIRIDSQGWMSVTDSILQSQANAPITLSSAGDLAVDRSRLDSSSYVELNSGGQISAVASLMKTISWTDIVIRAKDYLSVEGATLQASRDILVSFLADWAIINGTDVQIGSRDNTLQVNQSGVQVLGRPAAGCINNNETSICP